MQNFLLPIFLSLFNILKICSKDTKQGLINEPDVTHAINYQLTSLLPPQLPFRPRRQFSGGANGA